jgi:isohexenylglutaconyl-CoA hydratase
MRDARHPLPTPVMTPKVLRTREGAIERWTLNAPSTRNALDDDIVGALLAACADVAGDATLRFIVVQGSGGAFSGGGAVDGLSAPIACALPGGQPDPLVMLNRRLGDLLHALCELPQVLIAAVDGPAMGGGFGLVCCADFVVATPRSVFATPEVTLGVAPAQIAPFVWRRLGDASARQMLIEARRFTAAEAVVIGLVNELGDDLPATTAALIAHLRRAAPGAVAATKRLLHSLATHAVQDVRDQAAQVFAASMRGPEAAEGLEAFAAKRAPRWTS